MGTAHYLMTQFRAEITRTCWPLAVLVAIGLAAARIREFSKGGLPMDSILAHTGSRLLAHTGWPRGNARANDGPSIARLR